MVVTEQELLVALRGRFPTLFKELDNVKMGDNCQIHPPVNIYRCRLGKSVNVGPFCEIQNDVIIGDNTVISSHSFIAAGTIIGDNVFVGHGVITCNDRYPYANNDEWECEPCIIGSNASIGSGAVILPGVTIGPHAMIGAGAIVTKNVAGGLKPVIGVW